MLVEGALDGLGHPGVQRHALSGGGPLGLALDLVDQTQGHARDVTDVGSATPAEALPEPLTEALPEALAEAVPEPGAGRGTGRAEAAAGGCPRERARGGAGEEAATGPLLRPVVGTRPGRGVAVDDDPHLPAGQTQADGAVVEGVGDLSGEVGEGVHEREADGGFEGGGEGGARARRGLVADRGRRGEVVAQRRDVRCQVHDITVAPRVTSRQGL